MTTPIAQSFDPSFLANLLGTLSTDQQAEMTKALLASMAKPVTTPASIPLSTPEADLVAGFSFNPGTVSSDFSATAEPTQSAHTVSTGTVITSANVLDKENNMPEILNETELAQATEAAKTLLKAYTGGSASAANGAFVCWNNGTPGGPGGSTFAYVGPAALKRILNGTRPEKVEFNSLNAAGEYDVRSARRVILDDITGAFRIFEPNLHIYNAQEGKYIERAGYIRIVRGNVEPIQNKDIILEIPTRDMVVVNANGMESVVPGQSDWGTKSGWAVLHSTRMDANKFYIGRLISECANASVIEIEKNLDGTPKKYTDRNGVERLSTKKSRYGADLDIIRKHEIVRHVAMGHIVVVTDWLNKEIMAGHQEEIGKHEQSLFLSKVVMDKTFLRIRKNETSQVYDAGRAVIAATRPSETQVAKEFVNSQTGEIVDGLVERVFNIYMQPISVTRSELAAAGRYMPVSGNSNESFAYLKIGVSNVDQVIAWVKRNTRNGIKLNRA